MSPRVWVLVTLLVARSARGLVPADGGQADAGQPDVYDVLSANAMVKGPDDLPLQVGLAGGCWMSTNYCVSYARELAASRAKIAVYEADTSWWAPGWKWLVAVAAVGLAVGLGVGAWVMWKVLK